MRVTWTSRVAIALLFGFLAACQSHGGEPELAEVCQAGVVRLDDGLAACGRMEPSFVRRIETRLRPGDARLQLTSGGGEGEAAMALADLIEARGLRLEIAGLCLSACAHFVYAPTRDAVVLSGGLVGFHHTASLIAAFPFADVSAEDRALGTEMAATEAAFYRRRGLPVGFLLQPGLLITACMAADRHSTRSRMTWITPRRDKMELIMGRPVRGFWPKDSRELGEAYEAVQAELGLPRENMLWSVGGLTPAPLDALEEAFSQIPICTPEQERSWSPS